MLLVCDCIRGRDGFVMNADTSLAFFLLEQTAFVRDGVSLELPRRPDGFLASRIALLFPGNKSVIPVSGLNLVRQ